MRYVFFPGIIPFGKKTGSAPASLPAVISTLRHFFDGNEDQARDPWAGERREIEYYSRRIAFAGSLKSFIGATQEHGTGHKEDTRDFLSLVRSYGYPIPENNGQLCLPAL